MAKITMTIGNAKIPEIVAALVGLYGDKPDGVADDDWIKSCLRIHLMDMVKRHKHRVAAKKNRADIATDVAGIGGAIT